MLNNHFAMNHIVEAAPIAVTRQNIFPVCFSRGEDNGIANVVPLQVSLPETSQSVDIPGGYGACIWTDQGKRKISIKWKGEGQNIVAEYINVRVDNNRFNICHEDTNNQSIKWYLTKSKSCLIK